MISENDESDFFDLNDQFNSEEVALGDSFDFDSFEEAVGSEEYADDIDMYDSSDDYESAVGSSEDFDEMEMYDSSDEYAVGDPYSLHYEVEVGDDDEVGFKDSEELSDDEVEAFNAFPEAIGMYDDEETQVGVSFDSEDDSSEVDIGQSKKDKMLLVYFLKKVLKGLPLPVRVLFVRRFKKRYQNKGLRGRMLEIVKRMRGTMKKNIKGADFRDKLKMMINRIRERITKHYAASRSMMAAKKLKAKNPVKEEEEEDDDKEEKKSPAKPKSKEMDSDEKESKYDGTSTFDGKYPLTKFY